MISYAPDHEDVVADRVLAGRRHGIYVDVDSGNGAATQHFQELGWRGLSVSLEPPQEDLASRPGNTVLTGLPAEPLSVVLRRRGLWPVDLVRLGARITAAVAAEAAALCPTVLIVNAPPPSDSIVEVVRDAGLVEGGFDGVNHYFVRRGEEALLALCYPACSRDDFVDAGTNALRRERDELRAALAGRQETSPSRRFGWRGKIPEAPVIELDRIAIIDAINSGGRELGELLSLALGMPQIQVEHPADIDWLELPDRIVINLTAPYSEYFHRLLTTNAFRVISLASHPFEQLMSLRVPEADMDHGHYLQWATSDSVVELVASNAQWIVEPGIIQVGRADLAENPYDALLRVLEDVGFSSEGPTTWALGSTQLTEKVRCSLSDLPDWRDIFDDADLAALAPVYRSTLQRLGIVMASGR